MPTEGTRCLVTKRNQKSVHESLTLGEEDAATVEFFSSAPTAPIAEADIRGDWANEAAPLDAREVARRRRLRRIVWSLVAACAAAAALALVSKL